ncbi:MAG: DNA polymerase I, partial [Bifidobacteriaceae bacterium]|nr:DNA polymerase I [Bifidobacteriaceae bacterium]
MTQHINDGGSAGGSVKSEQTDGAPAASNGRLLVVDGHSLAFRAFFALPVENFSTSWGQPTNAVWGFATMLSNVLTAEKPTHIGVAFDMAGGTFRQKMLPQYKGTRDAAPEELLSQLPIIQQMLQAFGVTYIEKKGYEGDDIIGTLATMGEDAGYDTLVLSGDRDAFQLVDSRITVLYPGHHFKDLKHMTPQAIEEKYKVTPQQYPDLAAMRGEQADNIPGVPGVGDGYAAKWINQYGGLEQIIAHADEIKGKKGEALRDSIDQVRLNRKVNALVRDLDLGVTVDDLKIKVPDRAAVDELFQRLEFSKRTEGTLLKPFPQGEASQKVTLDLSNLKAQPQRDDQDEIPQRTPVIDTVAAADLPQWVREHCQAALAPAPEGGSESTDGADDTAGAASADAAITPESIAAAPRCDTVDDSHVWVIDAQPKDDGKASKEGSARPELARLTILAPDNHVVSVAAAQIDERTAQALSREFAARAGSLAVHGYKEAIHLLGSAGIAMPEPWLDTKLAAYLDSAGSKQDLEDVIGRVLPTGTFEPPAQAAEVQPSLFDDPLDDTADVQAAARRTVAVAALAHVLATRIADRGESALLHDIEYPVSRILARMESTGAAVDQKRLQELFDTFAAGAHQAEDAAWDAAGRQMNLQSPKQVQGVLFDDFKLAPGGRTKSGGYKTDSDSLMELALRNAGDERASGFITSLLRYREIVKLKQCVETLQKSVNPDDGLIHTTYEQTVTATGRLSSANPNLQNVPNRNAEGREIRSAFVPASGFVSLLSSDYSQVELRIMAHLSSDEALIEAFRSGKDFHRYVASLVYEVPVDQITADQRTHVKAMSYGLAYGLSTYGLAQQLRISPAAAD